MPITTICYSSGFAVVGFMLIIAGRVLIIQYLFDIVISMETSCPIMYRSFLTCRFKKFNLDEATARKASLTPAVLYQSPKIGINGKPLHVMATKKPMKPSQGLPVPE